MAFATDQILWYNNGVWGQLGYASPNFGDHVSTANSAIAKLVAGMGRNLFAIMQDADALLRTPPSINTITRLHKTIIRARQIMSGRMVPPGTPRKKPTHVSPAYEDFRIYPCPYFGVRNEWMREYCGLALMGISEACQHTDNEEVFGLSQDFTAVVGQNLQQVYILMATELLQIPLATAQAVDFTLTDAQLAAYDPSKWFTRTEMVDERPQPVIRPTEDDMASLVSKLGEGIPAEIIKPFLQTWPLGGIPITPGDSSSTANGATATPAATGGAFVPAASA